MEALKTSIEALSKEEHIQIARLIVRDNNLYNENQNGIFVNLATLRPDTLKKITTYVEYISQPPLINE